MKILIVDDLEMLRTVFRDTLSREGHEILTANGAEMALQILSEESDIEILISDLDMEEVDIGFRLLRTAQGRFPNVRRLLMSARMGDDLNQEVKSIGIEEAFAKKDFNSVMRRLGILSPLPAHVSQG